MGKGRQPMYGVVKENKKLFNACNVEGIKELLRN
jgi:hypothetical protein